MTRATLSLTLATLVAGSALALPELKDLTRDEFHAISGDVFHVIKRREAQPQADHHEHMGSAQTSGAAEHRDLTHDCVDTNNGATDSTYGYDCALYEYYPSYCGLVDDDDFSSLEMCCDCGGGVSPTPAPTISLVPTISLAPTYTPTDAFMLNNSCLGNLVNDMYQPVDVTASGAWAYQGQKTGTYLYYDPDCAGLGMPAMWMFTPFEPSYTAPYDLDGDGSCAMYAYYYVMSTDPFEMNSTFVSYPFGLNVNGTLIMASACPTWVYDFPTVSILAPSPVPTSQPSSIPTPMPTTSIPTPMPTTEVPVPVPTFVPTETAVIDAGARSSPAQLAFIATAGLVMASCVLAL